MSEPSPAGGEAAPELDGWESPERSIWPAIYPELLRQVREHNSTIIFVNNRRAAERVALRLNELAVAQDGEDQTGEARQEIARAHHGSLAREERTRVEELLKAGRLPCLVATSSLELGIDMGAVDLVLQIESPKSVARGLQRIGRAGHGVGELSVGRIFPKFRGDLLESAVVARRMREGLIEPTVVPRNALDVLAQQIVAIAVAAESSAGGGGAGGEGDAGEHDGAVAVDELHALVRRTHSYAELSRELLENVLDMLDGRYPSRSSASCERGSCGTASPARSGRARAPASSRWPTPARSPIAGLFAVTLPGRTAGGRARRGDGVRGARRPDLPAGRLQLAHRGDRPRPRGGHARSRSARRGAVLEGRLGRARQGARGGDRGLLAVGCGAGRADPAAGVRPRRAGRAQPAGVPGEQLAATRVLPSERTIVLERFRDEIGDWRLCVLSPYGGPRALGVGAGAVGADARALRRRGRRDRRRRRDRAAPTRPRRRRHRVAAVGRRAAADGSRGGRAGGHRRARRLGAVRSTLPRERIPRAADTARLPGSPHAAVAATAEGPEPARGGTPLQRLPDRAGDLPRVPAGRARRARPAGAAARPALARGLAGGGRDADRLAVRVLAAVRLRRDLHVRGRHADAPSAGPPCCRWTATCCASCSARRSCAS